MESKTEKLKDILKGTAFSVRQKGGKYIFERMYNDGKFVPDTQILHGFENAKEWATGIKSMYNI